MGFFTSWCFVAWRGVSAILRTWPRGGPAPSLRTNAAWRPSPAAARSSPWPRPRFRATRRPGTRSGRPGWSGTAAPDNDDTVHPGEEHYLGETNGQESYVGEQKMHLKSQRSLDSLWKLCALAEQPHKHWRNINEALLTSYVHALPCCFSKITPGSGQSAANKLGPFTNPPRIYQWTSWWLNGSGTNMSV